MLSFLVIGGSVAQAEVGKGGSHIKTMVPGLWHAIGNKSKWPATVKVSALHPGGAEQTEVDLTGEGNTFARAKLKLNGNHLAVQEVAATGWIGDFDPPLVPGKGLPASRFILLFGLHDLGVSFGGLASIGGVVRDKASTLNVPGQMLRIQKRAEDVPISQLAKRTRIYRLLEDVATQSGHQVKLVSVSNGRAQDDGIIKRVNPWHYEDIGPYELVLELEPFSLSQGQAP